MKEEVSDGGKEGEREGGRTEGGSAAQKGPAGPGGTAGEIRSSGPELPAFRLETYTGARADNKKLLWQLLWVCQANLSPSPGHRASERGLVSGGLPLLEIGGPVRPVSLGTWPDSLAAYIFFALGGGRSPLSRVFRDWCPLPVPGGAASSPPPRVPRGGPWDQNNSGALGCHFQVRFNCQVEL